MTAPFVTIAPSIPPNTNNSHLSELFLFQLRLHYFDSFVLDNNQNSAESLYIDSIFAVRYEQKCTRSVGFKSHWIMRRRRRNANKLAFQIDWPNIFKTHRHHTATKWLARKNAIITHDFLCKVLKLLSLILFRYTNYSVIVQSSVFGYTGWSLLKPYYISSFLAETIHLPCTLGKANNNNNAHTKPKPKCPFRLYTFPTPFCHKIRAYCFQ